MKYLESLALAVLAVFAPIKATIIVTFVLVLVDMATGVYAAWKRGEPITSTGFKRTVAKLALYETCICLGYLVQTYMTGDLFPASKVVTALVGLVELKSITENIGSITGSDLTRILIGRISQAEDEMKK